MADLQDRKLKAYEQLCSSYRAIDDFRAKLLALLPLATGGGIFLLIGDQTRADAIKPYLPAIGLFGFVVTLGLFFFELHGILKCTRLIEAGTKLEENLGINKDEGQFIDRPLGIIGFINEPFAAGIIYPAVLAAWAFLAMDFKLKQNYSVSNLFQDAPWATWVFIVGFVVGVIYNLSLILPAHFAKNNKKPQEEFFYRLEERLLQPDVRKSAQDVASLLADDFIEFGSSGHVFNKQQIIEGLLQETPTQRSLMEFKASILAPDIVLATYQVVRYSGSGEQPAFSLRSSIWKLIDGRWQMVFHQGTQAKESR